MKTCSSCRESKPESSFHKSSQTNDRRTYDCRECVGKKIRSRGPEYHTWVRMRGRCNNPNNKDYPRYGGRGISVCDRWNSYDVFLSDIGRRPTRNHQLDRIDNDGGYSPENCRWATRLQNIRNSRVCRLEERSVICILLMVELGYDTKKIAEFFDTDISNVLVIGSGKNWTDVFMRLYSPSASSDAEHGWPISPLNKL